jgi:hypothetical protein
LGGTSAKSSRSIHSSGPRLKLRWPSSGWCGWAAAGLAVLGAAEDLGVVGQLELDRVETAIARGLLFQVGAQGLSSTE